MALLQRLFQHKKISRKSGSRWAGSDSDGQGNIPKLDRNKIRLIVYSDHDKGRTPLFDSDVIKKMDDIPENSVRKSCSLRSVPKMTRTSQEESPTTQKGLHNFKFLKLGSDSKVLEEMMFGSVAMAYKGSTLKVHFIRTPPQVMLSKVFCPEKPKRESSDLDTDPCMCSFPSSSSSDFSLPRVVSIRAQTNYIAHSMPMAVPSPQEGFTDSMDDDSGLASLTSSGSFHTPVPSPSGNSASSYNSLHRRWMRTQTTTLQSVSRKTAAMDQLQKQETSLPRKKKNKVALGILFSANEEEDKLFQNFFFSHITLFENHVEKLAAVIERAYFNRRNFVPMVMEALEVLRNDIYDLYTAPRLADPVWLNMMSFSNHRYVFCEKFINEFMSLALKFDNKSTNFFVSTLVSAVLTHHLAWVPTVTPVGGTSSPTYLDKHSAKWLDALAKTHPYNPLWAQLGDLYGGIGFPLKLARTVVVGKKADLVKKFLYVLSYFIRCSDIHERTEQGSLDTFINDVFTDASPSESEKTILDPIIGKEEGNSNHGNSCSVLTEKHVTGVCSCVKAKSDSLKGKQSRTEEWLRQVQDRTYCPETGSIEMTCVGDRTSREFGSVGVESGALLVGSPDCQGNVIDGIPEGEKISLCRTRGGGDLESSVCADNGHDCLSADGEDKENSSSDKENTGVENRERTKSARECRLSATIFAESLRIENVTHVRKDSSLVLKNGRFVPFDSSLKDGNLDSNGKPKSVLSRQLQSETDPKLSMSDVRKNFLKEGSNSMFDEYFEEGIEAKTIDDVAHQDRVVNHPLASPTGVPGHLAPEQQKMLTVKQTSTDKVSVLRQTSADVSVSRQTSADRVSTSRQTSVDKVSVSRQTSADKVSTSRQTSVDKVSVSRHNSMDKMGITRPTTLPPARCRSVTPTELSRRRHISSASSTDLESFDPIIHCKELIMPELSSDVSPWSIKTFDKNFGRSLLAGYSDHYMSDFVLHGTSDQNFRQKMLNDLQFAAQNSVLDEPIGEAVCVVADTDKWTVEVASSRLLEKSPSSSMTWMTSQLVCNLVESVLDLWKLKMSPEFCLMHLEDRLQEIYFKSRMLSEYVKSSANRSNIKELASMLGFDRSDHPLLVAIAGTHTPYSAS